MKATITKSIGNTYLVEVDEKYYDIVKWKTASSKIKEGKVLKRVNERLEGQKEVIEINERSEKSKENSEKFKNQEVINWIDKKRKLKEIISLGIDKREIWVYPYKLVNCYFIEEENPTIEYYLIINGYHLRVHKNVFDNESGDVEIKEKRSW